MSANNPPPIAYITTSDQDWYRAAPHPYSWVQGTPAVMTAPWQEQIRWQARDCLSKGQHQLAVLLSQAACELHTEAALERLMVPQGDPRLSGAVIRLIRRPVSFDNGQVRRLWAEWTGDQPAGNSDLRIDPAEWWKGWQSARDLRDHVAHRGVAVSLDQAAAAVSAAEKYIDHIVGVASRGAIPAVPGSPA